MPPIALPNIASVFPTPQNVVWLRAGEVEWLERGEVEKRLRTTPVMFCHRKMLAAASKIAPSHIKGLDVLELYAFVRPTGFAVPTVAGLLDALGMPKQNAKQNIAEHQARAIAAIATKLLGELAELPTASKQEATGSASMMMQGGWGWGRLVLNALGASLPAAGSLDTHPAEIWENLPSMGDQNTPPTPPLDKAIGERQVITRLTNMLGKQTIRPQQETYCRSLAPAFARKRQEVQAVIATAGTGTGKTLGYLAPATVWAETNQASVWISTYTRNLQHQIENETRRLYDEDERKKKVVTRKGRENYLCLLNLERALEEAKGGKTRDAIALGMMARWAQVSGDGDLTGDKYPAWLTDLFNWRLTRGLSDKPGECIHSACPHHAKCFIESNRGRARQSNIVIANHAVVMTMALINSIIPRDDRPPPSRYVFDEGHHLFDAADSAFATQFSGETAADLRRWLRGDEGGRKRGIRLPLMQALKQEEADAAITALDTAVQAMAVLPAADWLKRAQASLPEGALEAFFGLLHTITLGRAKNDDRHYSLEAPLYPMDERLQGQCTAVRGCLEEAAKAVRDLGEELQFVLEDESKTLDKANRQMIEGVRRGLLWRALAPLTAWLGLMDTMLQNGDKGERAFVDWIEITRDAGNDRDVGVHRHWLDPTRPFYDHVLKDAHGAVITSASLTDSTGHADGYTDAGADAGEDEWRFAERLVGVAGLKPPAVRAEVASPFDYGTQARIFVVSDMGEIARARMLTKAQSQAQAHAIAQLMIAAKGGGLALFTAIRRMREAYPHLDKHLSEAGLPLYAQHIGGTSHNTLVQIFRTEPDSCLMGTDALRDGVDVPGEALRLIVFDRMPWPRTNILFNARAAYFGETAWRERQVRMRLRQAFGRLIRHEHDRGVFVMLDNRMARRFASAFPREVAIKSAPIKTVVAEVKDFFADA